MELIDRETLEDGFRLGDFEVLPRQVRVRSEAGEERLEPGVMDVLVAIARRDGNLITRDELVDEVWGRPTADGPIDRRITLIRKALNDRAKPYAYVETLPKRGFRLLLPVEPLKPPTPQAVADDPATVPAPSVDKQSPLVRWVVGLAAVAVSVFALWPRAGDTQFDSIAVLPFDNLSAAPGDDYLVNGFKEELVQTLHRIDGLTVINVRIEPSRDAPASDVDTLLYGSLQRSGNVLKVSYTIEDSGDGKTLAAGDVSGSLDELFQLQEQLAQAVQAELYPGLAQVLVSRSRPASAAAYNEYMLGAFAFDRRGQPGKLEEAIQRFEATIDLDPNYGPAYLQLATAYALLPDYRGANLAESNALALATVDAGIDMDSNIEAAAGAVYGFVYHKEKRWADSERAYERAVNAQFVDPNAFNWYSRMLGSVGDLHGALSVARRGVELAPDSAVLNSRVAMVYTWLGDNDNALKFYERANALGADGSTHLMAFALLLNRTGNVEGSYAATRTVVEMEGVTGNWVGPVFAALADPAAAPEALAAVNAASENGELAAQVEVVLRNFLGDVDGAMDIARRLEEPGEVFEMDLLYTPELRRLREHPGFGELMRRLGVQAYWRANSCVFMDGDVSCPDA